MSGNVDGHVSFAVLDAPLVIRDVERRQERGDDRKSDCDPDVPKSYVIAAGLFLSEDCVLYRPFIVVSPTDLAPKSGSPPPSLWIPSQMISTNWPNSLLLVAALDV